MMLDPTMPLASTEPDGLHDSGPVDQESVIDVHAVSKKFARSLRRSLFYAVRDLGREFTGRAASETLRKDEFWALQDVSFSLKRGEAIGIVGPNGAGKSTLLKIITGIIKPTTGYVRTRGRVQALIELGAGMNPILSGRENIYVRAMLLGMSKATIDQRFDEIVDFAELDEFIDMPVQNYSSGMRVKLGFSIAIHVDPDILILDEVLAVGDQRFRARARDAMADLLKRKVALIFISHNIDQVINITDTALWIDKGRERSRGSSRDICAAYVIDQQDNGPSAGNPLALPMPHSMGALTLEAVDVDQGLRDEEQRIIIGGETGHRSIDVTLTFAAESRISNRQVYYTIFVKQTDTKRIAYNMIQDVVDVEIGDRVKRTFRIDLSIYNPGVYQLGLEVRPENEISCVLYGTDAVLQFTVQPATRPNGPWKPGQPHDFRRIYSIMGPVVLPVEMKADVSDNG